MKAFLDKEINSARNCSKNCRSCPEVGLTPLYPQQFEHWESIDWFPENENQGDDLLD